MRTKISFLLVTVALGVGSSSVALAQTSTVAPAAEVAATPAQSATANDPNIDRGFLLPTAMTQPAGTITYNNYELLFHGVSYGVTDRIQATLTVLSPITTDMPFVGLAAVKGRIVSTDRFNVSVQGSVGWLHEFNNSDSASVNNAYTLGAGAFASYCLREDCSSLLSASATYEVGFAGDSSNSGRLLVYGGSIVHRVSPHIKLLGEVASAAVGPSFSGDNSLDNAPGVLASYGVRFHTDSIAGDVGFMKPFDSNGNSGGFLMGFPFVSFSYRWD
ncbi:MAG TPA: hypothetical protein VLU24_01460 [Mycobacterium sp.]|nr:hypothetical protein [Mycobacterium sp.]